MGFFFQAFFPRVREPADWRVTCTPSPRAKAAAYAGVQVGSGAGCCHVNRARALDTRGSRGFTIGLPYRLHLYDGLIVGNVQNMVHDDLIVVGIFRICYMMN